MSKGIMKEIGYEKNGWKLGELVMLKEFGIQCKIIGFSDPKSDLAWIAVDVLFSERNISKSVCATEYMETDKNYFKWVSPKDLVRWVNSGSKIREEGYAHRGLHLGDKVCLKDDSGEYTVIGFQNEGIRFIAIDQPPVIPSPKSLSQADVYLGGRDQACSWISYNEIRKVKRWDNNKGVFLILDYVPLFDSVGCAIMFQDESILPRGRFDDMDVGIVSFDSPEYTKEGYLLIRGRDVQKDKKILILSKTQAADVKQRVERLNERYNVFPRWRAEVGDTYYIIDLSEGITTVIEEGSSRDDINYYCGNYFQVKQQAQQVAQKLKAEISLFQDKFIEEDHKRRRGGGCGSTQG